MMQEFKVTKADEETRLDRWFKRHYPNFPTGEVQKACRKGLIRVDGVKAKPDQRLLKGQKISVKFLDLDKPQEAKARPDEPLNAHEMEETRRWVLHEDKHKIILNKPAGLAVQGGSGLKDHLDRRLDALATGGERPKLVHRLDKDTSGCLLLAKSTQAATYYTKLFRHDEISKTYLALVCGVPQPMEGQIESRMQKTGTVEKMRSGEEGKVAITDYEVLDYAHKQVALVALKPITGRTHQLRVHMAEMECPILGDGKYGGKEAFITGGDIPKQLHLHAWKIEVGGKVYVAPLPPHLKRSMKMLGLQLKDTE
jgi:23S rRNA pseudouridine955/2504/2580 synthase